MNPGNIFKSLPIRLFVLLVFLSASVFSGCSKNKFSCDAYGNSSHKKHKKNRSNYNSLYSPKAKPTSKNYLIRNKSSKIY